MRPSAEYMNLPFDEAIAYFRQKLSVPTATWKDLWQAMHDRAFTVAGAMREDLLEDLRKAVDKGIAEGTTLAEFRSSFDVIVQKHGWIYNGGRGWRTAVIFNTNLTVAYSQGNYRQMVDPAVLKARPYLRYVGSSAANPRPEHQAWANIILPADDPWWDTHYPPNGWGCKCGVVSHSEREVQRLIAEEKTGPNPVKLQAPGIERYDWTDKDTGRVHRVPEGIDPGWDYHPGKTGFRD